ncbi:stealth family protein [Streptomyces sp. NPDC047046]|uniref:stealth family protein n=1 Tax=Streptomyces sp. NPDC047046 TaxID=3155378 RepID=UPI0033D9EF10
MHNPEAPRLVGAYRRIVPEQTRRLVAGRVTPEVRQRVKLSLASAEAVRQRMRGARAAREFDGYLVGPRRRIVQAGKSPRIALAAPDTTPLGARRANLDDVLDLLTRSGIEHFVVHGATALSSAVAVRAHDRAAVLRAVLAQCGVQPGYAAAVHGRRVQESAVRRVEAGPEWQQVSQAATLRLVWYRTDPSGRLVLGADYGCDLEFWTEEDGQLYSPREGRVADTVPADGPLVEAPEAVFTDFAPAPAHTPAAAPEAVTYPTRAEFRLRTPFRTEFPIDAVYTWVDGGDPAWGKRRAQYAGVAYHAEAANDARYLSRDELRYSLRSLHAYAPWVRTVYLVTDDQAPDWLRAEHPGLVLVDHRDIFREPSVLPTYNSHSIESQLHHIDGLSEHFLYLNDDVLLGREVLPQDFFLANGISKFFLSPALIPLGPVTEQDPPVAAAGKNNRRVVEECFGTVPVQKMKHMPHALNRSVLAELEERLPEEHARTAASRFRDTRDLSLTSSLHHYYAFHTGRAVPGSGMRYAYIDLSGTGAERRLGQLLARRDRHVFCVNDTASEASESEAQTALLHRFLDDYFPVPSPFERPAGEK